MKRVLARVSLVAALVLGHAASVAAATITIGPDCDTCGDHNTAFSIDVALLDATEWIYDVTITATYGNALDYAYLTAIGIKFDGSRIENFVNVSGPDGLSWSRILGALSNGGGNGCSGNPGAPFACTDSVSGATPPGPDTWILTLDFDSALNLAALSGSFKARFEDSEGRFVGPLISEEFVATRVPEPGSLTLLGLGLAFVASRRDRQSTVVSRQASVTVGSPSRLSSVSRQSASL